MLPHKEKGMGRLLCAALMGLLAASLAAGEDAAAAKPPATKKQAAGTMTGQCHCGHVKYRVQGPIRKCSTCDCRGCQRATGALRVPFVTVLRSAFTITQGEPKPFRGTSKAQCDVNGVWHFCPRCGTQVFWKPHKGNLVDIFAGTLDDTSVFKPKK